MKNNVVLMGILMVATTVQATDCRVEKLFEAFFREAGVEGTMVVFDVDRNVYRMHNAERAKMRYVPASSFKIANGLIGLETGAVKSADEILPYGGGSWPVKSWEKDMSLREAIRISNVPVYKELARRIGLERMREKVAEFEYGNREIGEAVDRFWLEGPLKISAVEQVRFLARLVKDELPVSKEVQATVREMIRVEEGDGWTLYAKTGWAGNIGWWVGWVEKEGEFHAFALNMDILKDADAAKRQVVGKKCLELLGLIGDRENQDK